MRPKDMPAEWFSQTEDINYKDALQVTIALMSASRLLDCEEWEAAYNAFEKIMSHRHEVIGLLIKETACGAALHRIGDKEDRTGRRIIYR